MATATLTINISAEDLAKLKDLPAQVEGIINQSKQLIESVRNGDDPSNAFSGLLGNLSDLAGEAREVPALGALLDPIEELLSKLPAGSMVDLTAIAAAIEEVMAFFGPLKEVVLSGKIDEALQLAVDKVMDQAGDALKLSDEITSAQEGLTEFFNLFGAMMNWGTTAPSPAEAANLLCKAIIGIPHDLLELPATLLETAIRPLFEVLPAGPGLTAWRAAPAARLGFWQGINARLEANAAIDWTRLEIDLHAETQALLNVRAGRDQLISVMLGNLNRIDFHALDRVHAAIRAVPEVKPLQLNVFIDSIKNQLEGMVADLEDWAPTPEELRAAMRGLTDTIAAFMTQSPLGELRMLLVDFQHRLLLAIESLPFSDLARQAEEKLREIAKALDVLDPNVIRQPIHDFFQQIEAKMREFSADTVKAAIQQIWQGVEDALNQVRQMLEDVRETIAGAIDQLRTMVEQAQPALEQVSQAVASIKASLDSFDLSQPASIVIDQLHELKVMVAELDLSMLPGPAVTALNIGANTLRQINLSAEINPELDKVLLKIDPTPIVQQAAAALEVVTGKLKLLDPASIVTHLDAPIDELMKAVGNFGPDQLRKLLQEALKPVEDAIRQLDVEPLFAPLTRLLAELTAKVDSILDPEIIFKPLEEAFKPIVDIINAVDPNNLVHLLDPHATTVAEQSRQGMTPPAAISGSADLLKSSLSPVIEAEDDLFGLRPGDMLLPLIELHHQIAQAFDRLDDTILEPAVRLLRDALHGRLSALNPGNLELRIAGAFGEIHAEFGAGEIGDRLRDATDEYQKAVVAIANAGRANLAPEDAAVATRVIAGLAAADPLGIVPGATDTSGIFSATVNIEAGLDLSEMRSAFSTLRDLATVVPSFLLAGEVSVASLRQAIHDLDPALARVEINRIFDQLGQKIVGLQSALLAGIEELLLGVENFLTPVTPATIIELASQLHAALKEQLLAFSPATFKDEVKLIFDVVKKPLTAFDPSIIITELNGLRDALIEILRDIVADLLPDPAPFNALIAELEQFKPSAILDPIVDSLQPLSELIATLNVEVLLQPLLDAIARIRSQVPEVVAEIEVALDDVLSAFPEGGPASDSMSFAAG